MRIQPGCQFGMVLAEGFANLGIMLLLEAMGKGGADHFVLRLIEQLAGLVQLDDLLLGVGGRLARKKPGTKEK